MAEQDADENEFPRKLVFKREKGAGKLKLTFVDGSIEVKIGKEGAAYHLSRQEVRRLALWLKWYARMDAQETDGASAVP